MPKILVDDQEHVMILYSEELRSKDGYEVITAQEGHKLLECCKEL